MDINLVLSRETIHRSKFFTSGTLFDNLINKSGGMIVLRICLVHISKVYTQKNGPLIFANRYKVRKLLSQGDQVDEANFDHLLHLFLDG